MIEIPPQLRYSSFRFLRLNEKDKEPLSGTNWTKENSNNRHTFNDPQLLTHNGNYGVITGPGHLRVIDCDTDDFVKEMEKFFTGTFAVNSSRGRHFYFFCDTYDEKAFKNLIFKNEKAGEYRIHNSYVVGPGSLHKSGAMYTIVNNKPLQIFSEDQIKKILEPYLKRVENEPQKDKTRSGIEFGRIMAFMRRGLDKENIFKKMTVYSKWNEAGKAYQEHTYNNALKKYEATQNAITVTNFIQNQLDDFLEEQPIYYDENGIYWVWDFDKGCWAEKSQLYILNKIDDFIQIVNDCSSNVKNQIIYAIQKKASRLDRKPSKLPNSCIQFRNTIINLETNEEFESSPKYFTLNPLPFKIGESEETPNMDKFFNDWVGPKYVKTLYEILAFCLAPTYFISRIWVFVGRGSNGKSTFLELVEKFVGEDNCGSSRLDLMTSNRFETIAIFKKLVCFMGETNFTVLDNTQTLKSITGRDTLRYEIKGGKQFSDHNYAKILISTNTLPQTADKTEGFYRRFSILDWNNKFDEVANILQRIPDSEFENLSRKCIGILKNLLKTCKFTNEGTIEERAQAYEEKSNPLSQFLKEKCIIDVNCESPVYELQNQFQAFLEQRGYRKQSPTEIGMSMKKEGFETKHKNVTKKDGTPTTHRYYLGIQLKYATESKEMVNNLKNPTDSRNIYKEMEDRYV